ncbi:MAG: HXXEE domain-containing protein [Methylovirgula sp.]
MIKSWLETHWLAGAIFMCGAFWLLLPTGVATSEPFLWMIYLASPLYMMHQVEEHTGDRFRIYVNKRVFGGVEALTVADVLWINLPGVWGVNLLALYAAHFFNVGWGLAASYLMLVNGIAHVAMAIRFRGYNPGFVTGALIFIPFGLASALMVPATATQQIVGLAISIAIHAGIIVLAKHNVAASEHDAQPIKVKIHTA